MNENSSKQVLLSILGIAVLVVAVVGVSFAFFSYTKTGETNNVITTGQIYMYLTDGNQISLTNAFPMTTAQTSVIAASTENVGALDFTVSGLNESTTDITYNVYLLPGTAPTGEGAPDKLLKDSEVSVIMTATSDATENNPTNNIATAKAISELGTLTNGVQIATGTIKAGQNTQVNHTYRLNMYVNETVKISDTDATVNGVSTKYCAHAAVEATQTTDAYGCELGLEVYDEHYYAVKVQVVGNTVAGNIAPDLD